MHSVPVALVTGAARGIGRAVCEEFASREMSIAALDTDHDGLQDLASALGNGRVKVLCLRADVTNVEDLRVAVDKTVAQFGSLDILVNNAAIVRYGSLGSLSLKDWDEVMAVNLRAPFLITQLAGRAMIEKGRGGSIINISSIAGHTANPGNAAYSISKAAIRAMTEQVAIEWQRYGIRCNAVSPGITDWFMLGAPADAALRTRQAALVPLRRPGTIIDVARVVGFLASEASAMITGSTFVVDGGFLSAGMVPLLREIAMDNQSAQADRRQ